MDKATTCAVPAMGRRLMLVVSGFGRRRASWELKALLPWRKYSASVNKEVDEVSDVAEA